MPLRGYRRNWSTPACFQAERTSRILFSSGFPVMAPMGIRGLRILLSSQTVIYSSQRFAGSSGSGSFRAKNRTLERGGISTKGTSDTGRQVP